MGKMSKTAAKIGWLPVSVIVLIITLLSVSIGVFVQQNAVSQQQSEQNKLYQQQIFNILSQQITAKIANWQTQVKSVAERSADDLLLMTEFEQVLWQQEQLSQFAEADHLCLIRTIPSAPVSDGCLPITYASLQQLRQLQKTGKAEAVYIQSGDASHLLFVERLDPNRSDSPILMVAISSEATQKMVSEAFTTDSYIELVQGGGGAVPIARYGQAQLKNEAALFQKRIPSSYLQVNYWGAQTATPMTWLVLISILSVIVIVWVVQQVWLNILLRHDANCISQQIADYEDKALKPAYVTAFPVFHEVTDAMQRLAALAGSKSKKAAVKPVVMEDTVDEAALVDMPQQSLSDPSAQHFTSPPPADEMLVDEAISDSDAAMFAEQTETALYVSEPTLEEQFEAFKIEDEIEEKEDTNTLEFVSSQQSESDIGDEDNSSALESVLESVPEEHVADIESFSAEPILDFDAEEHDTSQTEQSENEEQNLSAKTELEPELDKAESVSPPKKTEQSVAPPSDVPDALMKLWEKKD